MAYQGAGCGVLGTDPLTDIVDTQNEWNFYSDNLDNQNYPGNKAIGTLANYQATLQAE